MLLRSLTVVALGLATQVSVQQPLSFDVAAIHQNLTHHDIESNVPLGPGDIYSPTGGIFRTSNVSVLSYISFAYRLNDAQLQALRASVPAWVASDGFNIEARTVNTAVSKDQLRLMMRSLLAERFRLAVHYESRSATVFAVTLVKPGVTGPQLQPQPTSASCSKDFSPRPAAPDTPAPPPTPDSQPDGFPTFCGGIVGLPASAPDRYRIGARGITLAFLANSLGSWENQHRTFTDETNVAGLWKFILEFTPDPPPPNTPDSGGPSFLQAIRQQLGLKLEPRKSTIQLLILDHIDHLTAN